MTTLPKLFKQTKTLATQTCSITVEDATYTVTWGQLEGKLQTKTTTCTGKNIGRSNETSPQEQAILEARSKHQKKIDEGYSTSITSTPTVQLPMKVKTYQDVKNNVKFPCLCSPKLNGVNSLFRLDSDNNLTHWSRGGKPFPMQPHLEEHIIYALQDLKTTSVNGELYIHGQFLEDITSATKKLNELSPKLEFFAFEFPDLDLEFEEKQYVLNGCEFASPEVVELVSHEEIEDYHNTCVKAGYEGIVIRNQECKYEYNVRSSHAFKFKKALDAEFEYVSYTLDKNTHPVLTCKTKEGKEFKVKAKGTAPQKLALIEKLKTNPGKWYTVEYESISKYGIPLKGIGLHFRDCTVDGQPTI